MSVQPEMNSLPPTLKSESMGICGVSFLSRASVSQIISVLEILCSHCRLRDRGAIKVNVAYSWNWVYNGFCVVSRGYKMQHRYSDVLRRPNEYKSC